MADKAADRGARVEVPQSQGLVPRCGKSELAIGRDDNVRDEVVVTM